MDPLPNNVLRIIIKQLLPDYEAYTQFNVIQHISEIVQTISTNVIESTENLPYVDWEFDYAIATGDTNILDQYDELPSSLEYEYLIHYLIKHRDQIPHCENIMHRLLGYHHKDWHYDMDTPIYGCLKEFIRKGDISGITWILDILEKHDDKLKHFVHEIRHENIETRFNMIKTIANHFGHIPHINNHFGYLLYVSEGSELGSPYNNLLLKYVDPSAGLNSMASDTMNSWISRFETNRIVVCMKRSDILLSNGGKPNSDTIIIYLSQLYRYYTDSNRMITTVPNSRELIKRLLASATEDTLNQVVHDLVSSRAGQCRKDLIYWFLKFCSEVNCITYKIKVHKDN